MIPIINTHVVLQNSNMDIWSLMVINVLLWGFIFYVAGLSVVRTFQARKNKKERDAKWL